MQNEGKEQYSEKITIGAVLCHFIYGFFNPLKDYLAHIFNNFSNVPVSTVQILPKM